MKLASLFFKATLASVAYAQLATIQQAIGAVSDALGDLDTKVKVCNSFSHHLHRRVQAHVSMSN